MERSQITNISFGDVSGAGQARIEQTGVKNIHYHDNARSSILRELGTVDPRVERKRILHGKGSLLPGSCSWVFNQESFQRWWEDEETNILWIHGDPGKGKTMIAETIIQELSSRIENHSDSQKVLVYWFCQRADNRLNTANAILRGLLYLLITNNEACAAYLENHFQLHQSDSHQEAAFWNLWSQFTDLIKCLPGLEMYFCIDAIDECTVLSSLLLENVVKQATARNAKWVFTSRNEFHITERLRNAARSAHNSLELNSEFVTQAVGDFIVTKVDTLAREKGFSDAQSSQIKAHLQKNAEGTFLWVALVFDQLQRNKKVNASEQLLAFPPGLKLLYKQMLQLVQQQEIVEEAQICQQILRTVSTVFQPQKLEDLSALCEIPSKYTPTSEVENLVIQCGSFLTIRDGVVYLVHQSAGDFFVAGEGQSIFTEGIKTEHCRIATALIRNLRRELKRDMLDMGRSGVFITDLPSTAISSSFSTALQYACLHWTRHISHAEQAQQLTLGVYDGGDVDDFFQSSLLNWIEALAWLEHLYVGVEGLDALSVDLNSSPKLTLSHSCRNLQLLLSDAKSLLQRFYNIIEVAPLQVHFSALIFSPESSTIRKLFLSKQFPDWLLYKPRVPHVTHTLGRSVERYASGSQCFALSNDGKILASRSDDNTIRLRNVGSGQILRLLSYEEPQEFEKQIYPHHLEFSDDDRKLMCLYYPGFVVTWDLSTFESTGEPVRELEDDNPWRVTMSDNGYFSAFSFSDGAVETWDNENRTQKGAFTWDTAAAGLSLSLLAISPDGNTLGLICKHSPSRQDWFTIHRSLDGKLLHRSESMRWDHSYNDSGITFSPNSRLVALDDFGDLLLYKIESGKARHMWSVKAVGDPEGGADFTFSLDSRIIAVVEKKAPDSLKYNVHIRDTSSGELIHAISREGELKSLHFSASNLVIEFLESLDVWDMSAMELRRNIPIVRSKWEEISVARLRSDIFVFSQGDTIHALDINARDQDSNHIPSIYHESRFYIGVTASSDGGRIAAIGENYVKLFDASRASQPQKLASIFTCDDTGRYLSAFAPNCKTFVLVVEEGTRIVS